MFGNVRAALLRTVGAMRRPLTAVEGGLHMDKGKIAANALTRRGTLAGIGAVGAAAVTGIGSRTASAQTATLRWWSTQSVPAQLEAYKFQIAQFEAANPGIKVVFEPTSNETYAA